MRRSIHIPIKPLATSSRGMLRYTIFYNQIRLHHENDRRPFAWTGITCWYESSQRRTYPPGTTYEQTKTVTTSRAHLSAPLIALTLPLDAPFEESV